MNAPDPHSRSKHWKLTLIINNYQGYYWDEYKKLGYDKSKENNGSVEIFKSEFSNLKEQIRLFKLDDSINNKKNNLISNIQTAYENKKDDIEREKQNELNVIKNDFELEKKQIKEIIARI